jgi:hypothetical protein
MKTIPHVQSVGFRVQAPEYVFQPLTVNMLSGIQSRDFGHPYQDMQEQIGGNLYLWLQQSNSILWRVDETSPRVTIFENTTYKLGERFATLLRVSGEEGKAAVLEMVKALALSHYVIEHVIFKIEGNWSFKEAHPILNEQLKYFMFWLAQQELEDNDLAQKCLSRFMKMFATDVDLNLLNIYPAELVMESFIQCFFRRLNAMSILFKKLEEANTQRHAT